jgi:hypothetical protein
VGGATVTVGDRIFSIFPCTLTKNPLPRGAFAAAFTMSAAT